MYVAVIERVDGKILTTRQFWSEELAFDVMDSNLKLKENKDSQAYICEV